MGAWISPACGVHMAGTRMCRAQHQVQRILRAADQRSVMKIFCLLTSLVIGVFIRIGMRQKLPPCCCDVIRQDKVAGNDF